ncbi:hypothetical protein P167DRAFT_380472 [Morchella conica CCBAS932]|uniref:Uncharacterized protein n=1 Tax=Morchella conica CCBAS932 TaxID=1392247 RepID=A0A3N4L2A2_9PEZI|nr:hypothetical protein P167DRAFT_380472 [Morchella conica CCBAS932]
MPPTLLACIEQHTGQPSLKQRPYLPNLVYSAPAYLFRLPHHSGRTPTFPSIVEEYRMSYTSSQSTAISQFIAFTECSERTAAKVY